MSLEEEVQDSLRNAFGHSQVYMMQRGDMNRYALKDLQTDAQNQYVPGLITDVIEQLAAANPIITQSYEEGNEAQLSFLADAYINKLDSLGTMLLSEVRDRLGLPQKARLAQVKSLVQNEHPKLYETLFQGEVAHVRELRHKAAHSTLQNTMLATGDMYVQGEATPIPDFLRHLTITYADTTSKVLSYLGEFEIRWKEYEMFVQRNEDE